MTQIIKTICQLRASWPPHRSPLPVPPLPSPPPLPRQAVTCSACAKVISTGSSIYSCRGCKPSFDICFDCFNGLTRLKPGVKGAATTPKASAGSASSAAPRGAAAADEAREPKAKSAHAAKVFKAGNVVALLATYSTTK